MKTTRRILPGLVPFFLLTLVPAAAEELDVLPLGDPERAFQLGTAKAGEFYDAGTQAAVDFDAMVERMARARVVILGEEHTAMDQKLLQAKVLEAIADRAPAVVLGKEFFQRDDREALERFVAGEVEGDAFLLESGWYDRGSVRWEFQAPLMEAARKRGIRVVGLNVPRDIVRAVNRGGLDKLPDDLRAEVGELDLTSAAHRYLISRYFGDAIALMPGAWFDNMYAAQTVWDGVMARSILDNLPEDGVLVAIAGAGHVAYGLGIVRQIAAELERRGEEPIDVVTFCPVTAPEPEGDGPRGHPTSDEDDEEEPAVAVFSRSLADFVGVFADTGGVEPFPRFGLDLDDETPKVKRVWPGSAADKAGLETGDFVVDLNGETFADVPHLRLALARLEWGDRLDLRVRRGEGDEAQEVHARLLLEPDVEEDGDGIAPGWAIHGLDAFDPAASEPVTAPAEPDGPLPRLVEHDGKAERVEEWQGDELVAVHELDDDGRVARSVYRDPREDGTVEVRYPRGEDAAPERFDRAGQPIAP